MRGLWRAPRNSFGGDESEFVVDVDLGGLIDGDDVREEVVVEEGVNCLLVLRL